MLMYSIRSTSNVDLQGRAVGIELEYNLELDYSNCRSPSTLHLAVLVGCIPFGIWNEEKRKEITNDVNDYVNCWEEPVDCSLPQLDSLESQ
jgi:hypothetical protein